MTKEQIEMMFILKYGSVDNAIGLWEDSIDSELEDLGWSMEEIEYCWDQWYDQLAYK